jgi:magnesium transporter
VSVVAAHLYRNGKNAKAVSLNEPIDCKGKSEFVWIGLFEPSEQELEQLEKNYGLHPLAIEDALKANQLPKVDVYGDQLFVMTRTAHLEQDHIAYGETAIFVGKNFIITVRHGLGAGS